MSNWFVILQYLLPKRWLTRIAGKIANGRFLKNSLIRLFIRHYRVNMSEAAIADIREFKNFNAFFTRALKPGARPLAQEPGAVLCPADGAISEIGAITENRILQAKGRYYTVGGLLGDDGFADRFTNGSFATVYLSPRDYHRVHMPLEGKLLQTRYVPGTLFSVNQVTAASVPDLFARNERLVCLFDTAAGYMALVLVGAMIVAGIETVWAGDASPGFVRPPPDSPVVLAGGAEMGRFKLGSTAIVLFEPGAVIMEPQLSAGCAVKMGQLLARRKLPDSS